jgi:hypothetical protein
MPYVSMGEVHGLISAHLGSYGDGPVRALAGLALAVVLGVRPGAAITVPGTDGALDVDGYVDGLAVVDTGGGARERPQALGVLRADARVLRWLRGRLELRSRIGGPFEGGHQGVYNFVHTYQNRSPVLEVSEAYADFELPQTDVRVGIQKLAWGRLDGLPPTDVVNPRDYHDPFVIDVEEAKIGVPALAGTHHLRPPRGSGIGELRFSLLWLPFAVPPRLAEIEERWFPTALDPGGAIVLPRRRVELELERILGTDVIIPKDVTIPGALRTVRRRPPLRLDAGGIGGRLSGTWRGMDFSLSHYSGPENGPNVDLEPTVILEEPALPDSAGVVRLKLHSISDLRQVHDMTHMTGVDWATTFGPTTVRAEAAYFQERHFLRNARDLFTPAAIRNQLAENSLALQRRSRTRIRVPPLFPGLDAVEWGVGADYTLAGVFALAQVSEVILLEDAPRLLIGDPETRLVGVLRRPFLQERFEVELRGVYAVERGGWFAFPRASWLIRDDLRLRVGYLAIGGPRTSLFGQFGRNDEVVMQLRQSF